MIEARNIKLDGKLLYVEYKSDLNEKYEKFVFDIEKDEFISVSVEDWSKTEEGLLRFHLINHLIDLLKKDKIPKEYTNICY